MHFIEINEETYDDNSIYSGSLIMVESMTGDELQYDTFEVEVEATDLMPTLYIPKNSLGLITADNKQFGVRPYLRLRVRNPQLYTRGMPVVYKNNGERVGKFYMSSVKQTGESQYIINCVSAIGLLESTWHYGGIYNGVKVSELMAEIIGGVITYKIDPALANQLVYGWLPIATRRANLHQLLFAMSSSICKDENGDVFITSLSNETKIEIPSERIGMDGSIDYLEPATSITLSEHAYIARNDDEGVTLFEGTISADQMTTPKGVVATGGIILFDEPMHDIVTVGTIVIESGVNYAVLSPSSECMLTGKRYTHTVRQIVRPEVGARTALGSENNLTISDATLVSVANSENIANRLFSYYSSAKQVTTEIIVDGERPGAAVIFTDPFGDETEGIISEMTMTLGGDLLADMNVISGYEPPNPGNYYNNVSVITENSTFTVPEGVEMIRVVLIAGGDGGAGGQRGEDGGEASSNDFGEGGEGGLGGTGGEGGKVYIATIRVTPGQQFDVNIGLGGTGGDIDGGVGMQGTDTTFGELSSAFGTRSSAGYIEIFSGTVYATRGQIGVSGAKGGGKGDRNGSDVVFNSEMFEGGTYETERYEEGRWINHSGSYLDWKRRVWEYYSGGGGGAAVSYKLVNGDYVKYKDPATDAVLNESNKNCKGGDGANADDPVTDYDTVPGCGGAGGHGGGGGGGAGVTDVYMITGDPENHPNDKWTRSKENSISGPPGSGGHGSKGRRGANGCAIIYH